MMCPICAATGDWPARCELTLGNETRYDLMKCGACGTSFCHPLPADEDLARFYSASYYDFDPDRERGKGMAFARHLSRIAPTGRFLDVGCATGFFIDGIRNHSRWAVSGIDLGESAVRHARDTLGLDVRLGELQESDFDDRSFDYIHVNNVLEHVRDPVALLRACRRLITGTGRMHLSVPNGANDVLTLVAYHRQEEMPAFSHKGHIYFFPAGALLRMIADAGFTIERRRTHGFKRGLRNAGILPRKRGWKAAHRPRALEPATGGAVKPAPRGRARPDIYYRWRFLSGRWSMVPGLHRYGLDFHFLLRPARRG